MPGPALPAQGDLVAVCFDAASATAVIGKGGKVVLCGSDGEALAAVAVALRSAGRIAVLAGDPADDEVRAAACAMARELFGQQPVVWSSVTCHPQVAGLTAP